jgi:hypothetical protein
MNTNTLRHLADTVLTSPRSAAEFSGKEIALSLLSCAALIDNLRFLADDWNRSRILSIADDPCAKASEAIYREAMEGCSKILLRTIGEAR